MTPGVVAREREIERLGLAAVERRLQLGGRNLVRRGERDAWPRPRRSALQSRRGQRHHPHLAPAHLLQPGRGHHRPQAGLLVEQDDATPEHTAPGLGLLHELSARRVHGARHAAGLEFLGRAHVEQIERARSIGAPRRQFAGVDAAHAEAPGRLRRRRRSAPARLGRKRRVAPLLAAVQREAGEVPAHRAVLQRHHLVRRAGVDQRLRAHDRAGAPGAVDHHHGVRIGGHVGQVQAQLGARDAGRARDAHQAELVDRPAVQHDDVAAFVHPALQLVRVDMRRPEMVLDRLAECLARHVHAAEQLVAGGAPGGHAAVQDRYVGVAERGEPARRAFGEIDAVVDQRDPR
jgi:hypothetical protein